MISGTFSSPSSSYQVLLINQTTGLPSGASCTITSFSPSAVTCTTTAPATANPNAPYSIKVLNTATGYAMSSPTSPTPQTFQVTIQLAPNSPPRSCSYHLPSSLTNFDNSLSSPSPSSQYVNLWSRSSTWGGGPLPSKGDTVFIPSGVTILLDVSPPR